MLRHARGPRPRESTRVSFYLSAGRVLVLQRAAGHIGTAIATRRRRRGLPVAGWICSNGGTTRSYDIGADRPRQVKTRWRE